jgi:hypothetical protein
MVGILYITKFSDEYDYFASDYFKAWNSNEVI